MIDLRWDGWAANPTTRVVIDKYWVAGTPVGGLDCTHTVGTTLDCAYARGDMHIRPDDFDEPEPADTGFHIVQELSIDAYARGIGEMPYSWPQEALEAQAIAARSYARYQQGVRGAPSSRQWCWCSVYDRSIDQVYLGWGFDEVAQFGQYATRWVAAVTATANQVLLGSGKYVSTNYSASNGGASENNEDIWGGTPLPHLRSIPDPNDLIDANWAKAWTRSIPVDYFAARVGMDAVVSADIISTYVSGSPRDIAVKGIVNGNQTTKHYTASQFLTLFSNTPYRLYGPRIKDIEIPDYTASDFSLDRWWGNDRYATAVAISKSTHPSGARAVLIATGENYPDALTAAPMAKAVGGPVLLTRTASVPSVTVSEIQRLKPSAIYVLGGTAAVSSAVEDQLEAYAPVIRVWGHDRYATAAAVSKLSHPTGADVVYLATGRGFPDALAGAPAAGHRNGPLLLTDPTALPGSTLAEISRLSPSSIVVVGGGTSVSRTVVDQLKSYAPVVTSISGSDRYDTAVKISQQTFTQASTVFIATGPAYPDALAVGASAIGSDAPVLLVQKDSLPSNVAAELLRLRPARVVIVGGPAAVSDNVEAAILALLG